MIKAGIFDMDGTLVDSMFMWDSLVLGIFDDYGKVPTQEFVQNFLHYTVEETIQVMRDDFGFEQSADELFSEYAQRVTKFYREDAKLKPGAREILRSMKDAGAKICLATITDRPNVEIVLGKYDLLKYFDHLVTIDSVNCPKSDPKFFQTCFDLLETQADECAFFEDSLRAGQQAKEMGSFLCGLFDSSWDKESEDELKAISDVYAQDLSHVRFEDGQVFIV